MRKKNIVTLRALGSCCTSACWRAPAASCFGACCRSNTNVWPGLIPLGTSTSTFPLGTCKQRRSTYSITPSLVKKSCSSSRHVHQDQSSSQTDEYIHAAAHTFTKAKQTNIYMLPLRASIYHRAQTLTPSLVPGFHVLGIRIE